MHRLIGWSLAAAITLLFGASAAKFLFEPEPEVRTPTATAVTPPPTLERYQRHISFTEPVRTLLLPDNIFKVICLIGPPVLVSGWDLDPDTRFVFFEGQFLVGGGADPVRYFYTNLKHPNDVSRYNSTVVSDLADHRDRIDPETTKRLQIPVLKGFPDKIEPLRALLEAPTVEYEKNGKRRLVYDQKMCIGETLIQGAYVDIDDDYVVNAKGLTTPEDVHLAVNNLQRKRVPPPDDPDPAPIRYNDEPPFEGTAEYQLVELIKAREKGDREAALSMVSESVTSDFIRESLIRSMEDGSPVRLDSLTYQVLEVSHTQVDIEVVYHVMSGSLFRGKHRMVLEDGQWKAKF
ncbi:hypothetical protein [Saccharospirillum salsuginis]|uniref:Uncharacterized protein n=1 Tax=Saccharospirillum salsuginis TaxID=418750 RepID=A0A918N8W2_9GAMM|nr:hypothetical protein [Saccharospirillum salsuginis]GGX54807.1 hypothetical protein GCM10007392_22850 [Saccharospirillum salsuginis]